MPCPAITNQVLSFTPTTTVADTINLDSNVWTEGQVCRIAASQDVYIRFDENTDTDATSTDTLMVRGVEAMLTPRDVACISVLAVTQDAVVTITRYQ